MQGVPEMKPHPYIASQTGIALMEAVIALAVLAIGLLGLAGIHIRTLAYAQNSGHQLQATRLIEDLAERLRAHPHAQSVSSLLLTHGWTEGDGLAQLADCYQNSCTASQLATAIRLHWLNHVAASLPSGQGHIFASGDARSLGVMVAWHTNTGILPAYPHAFGSSPACPAHKACHLQYLYLGHGCLLTPSSACTGN